jgi:uracil-DNA glycosylase family protein
MPTFIRNTSPGTRHNGQAPDDTAGNGIANPSATETPHTHGARPSTVDECRRCDLWRNATQGVPGVGPKNARIMLIGEQPGDQEDLAGAPFIGPAGQLLDDALRQARLSRGDIYLTNAVKHFKWEPKGKRRLHKTPGQREINACAYWLDGELAEVKPRVIVVLGASALKAVLHTAKASLTDSLGKPFRYDGRWIVAIYHPSYVLRVPGEHAKARALAVMVEGLEKASNLSVSD